MRLFIALTLPEVIKDAIASLQYDKSLIGARWTKRNQWHITLHFVGEVDSSDRIMNILSSIRFSQFSLRMMGTGHFPPRGKPRVLWAGIETPRALIKLHRSIGQALQEVGYRTEGRPYKPHLTLARFKHKTPTQQQLDAYHQCHADFVTPAFTIGEFTLFNSDLKPTGAHYVGLKTYPAEVD